MILILDYGLGNPESVKNMLKKIGVRAEISSDANLMKQATLLIIPGVGHFATAMHNIHSLGLFNSLHEYAINKQGYVLGICLGMQLFFNRSEEGGANGLGWIDGEVVSLADYINLKVPHMGWSSIIPSSKCSLFELEDKKPRYYFVHSYFVNCSDEMNIIGTCEYGINFTCAVQKDNITGVQFHPEKSHLFGVKFFNNYLNSIGYTK
jgi:glutamine amidotransferase